MLQRLLMLLLISGLTVSFLSAKELKIDYEKYTLSNGLEVILHKDKSDPITSIAVLYHVGSNREETGRTGFAHLFEHMMFQESQHVGQDQFFKKIQGSGGTLNGGTSFDFTIYFEIVPRNALEMALWLESDRMGYLLSTVTQEAFLNQQEVVQNEKRQRVDNQPYGHTNYVVHKLLYPESHPYNWQVIGSLEDLRNATVKDVVKFFKKWYGPNNATLVVAGDYDEAQAKGWIKKYFGELKASEKVADPEPRNVELNQAMRAYHEDNFAKSPELNMVFPTINFFEDDAYALDLLGQLLSDGKKAPLYQVLVEEEKLAPSVRAFNNSQELTGDFRFRIRAFPEKNLGDVEKAIHKALKRFEEKGFSDRDLERIKAQTETNFYNGIASIFNKSFQLAYYNEYAGSPDYITEDIRKSLEVTREDIMRVYNRYIKGKNYVLTSFVPKGKLALIAPDSERFPVVEEAIEEKQETLVRASEESIPLQTVASGFDRNVEPAQGPSPKTPTPKVWNHTYKNGLRLSGIENNELPLVEFGLTIKGGLLRDDLAQVGVANLMTDIIMEGTKNRAPVELEEAIDLLGSRINMSTGAYSINIRANSLSSKLNETYAIFQEILLEPRWDEKEFARIKEETIERINRRSVNPSAVANQVFNRLIYGKNHILAQPTMGNQETVAATTLENLKTFYQQNYSPAVSYLTIAGNISKEEAIKLFQPLENKWQKTSVTDKKYDLPEITDSPKLYFVDFPDAKQSEIRIGYLALPYTHEDYYPATVMNYKLGGSFNGNLNLILREEKGFTYGARSGFNGSELAGTFRASAAVRSNATLESMQIFKNEISNYRERISAEDLQFTQDALVQSNARKFETLGAKRRILEEMARYGLASDYIQQRENIVKNLSGEKHQELAQKYLQVDKMVYLVIGDAKTQLEPLKELGLGDPVLLNRDGEVVSENDEASIR